MRIADLLLSEYILVCSFTSFDPWYDITLISRHCECNHEETSQRKEGYIDGASTVVRQDSQVYKVVLLSTCMGAEHAWGLNMHGG